MKSCMSNIHFVVQPVSKGSKEVFDEEEKFQEKLVQLSESIYSRNWNDIPESVRLLQQHRITDCVVGPEHLAFLLEDGRICRLGYTANAKPPQPVKTSDEEAKDKSQTTKSSRGSKSMRTSDESPWNLNSTSFMSMGGPVSWTGWGNRIGVIRSTSSTGSSSTSTSSARKTARMSQHSNPIPGSNIRLIRSGQVRGRNIPLLAGSQRVMVPASQVPEDLVYQVQAILQGKSRNVIVRELQRTNLDVNLAVNNLLSRDDEESEELDEAADFIPGEELMSLLDGGIHPSDHPRVVIEADSVLSDDLLGYSLSRAPLRAVGCGSTDRPNDPEDETRMSSPHWIDLFRKIEAKRQPKASTVSQLAGSSGISLSEDLEWWKEVDEAVKFKLIGAMHSELVAVDRNGTLRQWKWKSPTPHKGTTYHPRADFLGLTSKKVCHLAACSLRASVVTEGGAIATWMDDSVSCFTSSLDWPLSTSELIDSEKVKSLDVCSLYSAVLTHQGNVYCWGVPPFSQRKKLLVKAQNSLLQNLCKDSTSTGTKSEPVVGSSVCLRHFPIYQAGTVAINVSGGTPKIGKLLESVWDLEKACRFQILKDRDLEAAKKGKEISEAGDQGQNRPTTSSSDPAKSLKRKREPDDVDKGEEEQEQEERREEEKWDLKEVIFMEVTRSVKVGKVTKIDENIVAVDFSGDEPKGNGVAGSALDSCRLLHKNDIVVVKPSSSHVMDCIQRQSKKITYDSKQQLHCIATSTSGILAIANKPSSKLAYVSSLGKHQVQKVLPTSPESFQTLDAKDQPGTSKQINPAAGSKCKLLHCDWSCPTLLQDYNAMLFPLLADENDGIRDPLWADVPPLLASAMGVHAAPDGDRCTVTILAFQNQVLMPLVMRRDFPAFESLIKSIEGNPPPAWSHVFYKSLLEERCDGQRNLLHMCIEMSIPSSNKEQKDDEKAKDSKNSKYAEGSSGDDPGRDRPSEAKPSAATSSGPPMYMSDNEHAHAVNAIANVISAVTRGHMRSGQADLPVGSASRYVPTQPPGVDAAPQSSSSSNLRRPGAEESGNSALSPPESPLLPWPPELKNVLEAQSGEEGMNLSMSSSEKKSGRKTQSPSSSSSTWTEVKDGARDRGTRWDAVSILKLVCGSKSTRPHLKTLLTQKDTSGYTPFMFAVAHRAYPAALVLFNAALDEAKDSVGLDRDTGIDESMTQRMEEQEQRTLLSMIFPSGSDPDNNPLYMLCCNDTCSFTWTGKDHINQDIFECLTCGLTETLCCCSECARVCHKGHDCKLKRTSPTAYCDCWEKCACKSLVAGDAGDRISLLRRLLHLTELYETCDSNGHHILQFLIQTVARQVEEQRQWRPPTRTARMSVPGSRSHRAGRPNGKEPSQGGEQDMPEHDLHPPRFCREALVLLLGDWKAVRSLILGGSAGRRDKLSMSSRLDAKDRASVIVSLLPEDEDLLRQQTGTARLDQFTHTLLVKCASYEYLDKLLETLIHAVQSNQDKAEGVAVARRFLRSVIRVYVVLAAQMSPDRMAAKSSFCNQPTSKCGRAFLALIPLAIEELCESAESLIAPVRMGVARPTTSFLSSSTDVGHGSASAFSRQPFPPRSAPSDDDDHPDRPGTSGLGGSEATKASRKRKKSKKRSKRYSGPSQRYGSERRRNPSGVGEAEEEQNERDVEQPAAPQHESRAGEAIEEDQVGGESDRNESDMDLTDIEIIAETDSESLGSGDSVQLGQDNDSSVDMEPSQDREDEDEDEEEYDTAEQIHHDDNRDAKGASHHAEDEDTDSDHFLLWQDEGNLERQATRQLRNESRQTPHSMQWAMGGSSVAPVKPPRPSSGPGGGRGGPGGLGQGASSGILYVDNRSSRRSENLESAYINSIMDRRYSGKSKLPEKPRVTSSAVTNAQLARLFATCIREVSHLFSFLRRGDYLAEAPLNTVYEVSFNESKRLQSYVKRMLSETWAWLLRVVESTECQLRYGQVLSMASDPTHKDHPHHRGAAANQVRRREAGRHVGSSGTGEETNARQDFLGYALFLMRSRANEHSDLLPVVDVTALKHVAYVLDAYVYYLRGCSYRDDDARSGASGSRNPISLDIGYDNSENEDDEDDDFIYNDEYYSVPVQSEPAPPGPAASVASDEDLHHFSHPHASFFRRSESMTFLGCSDPNTFETPLFQALPLAEKPHLLQPTARKEELFGRPRSEPADPRQQVSSMSLTQRADQASRDVEEQPSTSSSSLPPAQARASNESAPPPPYSSVIRSTSSFVAQDGGAPVDGGKLAEPVAMETMPAPGAAVTVDVTSDNATSEDAAASSREDAQTTGLEEDSLTAMEVLGKSRLTLELFSRVFLDDVGNEMKSILQELGGFEVRESKFRKATERIRTSQTVDLQLNVERSRDVLIQQTFKSLNQHFKRRCGSTQPMAVLRVKVLFKEEPGEGTGVARSFYTAISEALLSSEPLPSLDGLFPGSSSSTSGKSASSYPFAASLYKRVREERSGQGARYRFRTSRRIFSSGASSLTPMATTSIPYHRRALSQRSGQTSMERSKQAIGERLYPKVASLQQNWAPKITGMLLSLPAYELLQLLRSELALQERVSEAVEQLVNSGYSTESAASGGEAKQESGSGESGGGATSSEPPAPGNEKGEEKNKKSDKGSEDQPPEEHSGGPPLFFQPGKPGFYAPTSWGEMNEARLNAFRNVGRIIGLCLLQNELCPIPLCRHVLKVILGRKVNWHDLAFFDPVLYESLRQLVLDAESEFGGILEEMDFTFEVDLQSEEGGRTVPLIVDGAVTPVTRSNVRDYVRRYALQRMVVCCRKPLEKIRQGVLDVIPRYVFHSLTPEDLRLLVNGCGQVDVRALISYTMFNDESGKSVTAEKLVQFKRWFWGVVDHLSSSEKQELLYFWTGSPSLPASEDGFQPMPTITIRPPDDHHLPSANTCISRLYVPLYASRQILKQKLTLAIKTKNFGFV